MNEGRNPVVLGVLKELVGFYLEEGRTLKGYMKTVHKDVKSDEIFLVGYSC